MRLESPDLLVAAGEQEEIHRFFHGAVGHDWSGSPKLTARWEFPPARLLHTGRTSVLGASWQGSQAGRVMVPIYESRVLDPSLGLHGHYAS